MSSSPSALESLCRRCGLCCDGTLFSRVPVSAEDAARLALHGVEVASRPDGSLALPQRCAALHGMDCSVYGDRPARCRSYHCNLYAALADGEVDPEEAWRVIEEAKARVRRLGEAQFGRADDPAVVSRYRAALADPTGPVLSEEARRAFSELQAWLDRHFRGR